VVANGKPSALFELREHLLGPTLDRAAAQSPFYRRTLGARAREVRSSTDLPALPLLDKAIAVDAGDALYADPSPDDRFVLSSGTTRVGRRVLVVRRGVEEDAALSSYQAAVARHHADERRPGPRVLVLFAAHHGLPSDLPSPAEVRVPWLPHENALELARYALVDARDRGLPFAVMRGSVTALLALAAFLEATGVDGTSLGLRYIGANSYELSPRARARLADVYGADVIESYSLSELPMWAPQCPFCGALHLDGAPVLPELVGLHDNRPLAFGEGNTGRLVLTGLFPYVERTPLIRYDTGDVVTLRPFCEGRGEMGMVVRGRAARTVSVHSGDDTPVHLFSSDVYRAADSLPSIDRELHALEVLGIVRGAALGAPRVRARARGRTLSVDVVFARGLRASRKDALCDELARRLCAADAALDDAVRHGRRRLVVRAVDRLPSLRGKG